MSVLRWSTRGRARTAVVAAVAGALLGSLLTVWQPWDTGQGDAEQRSLCWNALTARDLRGLWREDLALRGADTPVSRPDGGAPAADGTCRVSAMTDSGGAPVEKARLTVRLRQLNSVRSAEDAAWPDRFLTPGMTPLGKGLTGMADGAHAWVALPEQCADDVLSSAGPSVVELDRGLVAPARNLERRPRDILARAAVRLANGAMRAMDCDGTMPLPDGLPAPSRPRTADADKLCGVRGLRTPDAKGATGAKGDGRDAWIETATSAPGVLRSCALGEPDPAGDPKLRLMTVEDPRLADLVSSSRLTEGAWEYGPKGRALLRGDLAVYKTSCLNGSVVFLVRNAETERLTSGAVGDDARSLLSRYAAAESTRLGCGPVTVPHTAER